MKVLFLIILFVISILMIFIYDYNYKLDEFFTNPASECPNTLLKDGDKLLLYNPKLAKVPGVNPIEMNNLEDYHKYVNWQRKNKVNCPVLHLDKIFDKNSEMYAIKSSFDTGTGSGIMNHDLPVLNAENNTFYGNDPLGQDIGKPKNYAFNYYASNLVNETLLPNLPYLQMNTPTPPVPASAVTESNFSYMLDPAQMLSHLEQKQNQGQGQNISVNGPININVKDGTNINTNVPISSTNTNDASTSGSATGSTGTATTATAGTATAGTATSGSAGTGKGASATSSSAATSNSSTSNILSITPSPLGSVSKLSPSKVNSPDPDSLFVTKNEYAFESDSLDYPEVESIKAIFTKPFTPPPAVLTPSASSTKSVLTPASLTNTASNASASSKSAAASLTNNLKSVPVTNTSKSVPVTNTSKSVPITNTSKSVPVTNKSVSNASASSQSASVTQQKK
jgi:hypothetical protein